MKMKNCELCKGIARMHCESDRASLCWSCDFKVHSANFLVARHSRTLLCHVCQSPTPWTAAGLKLGHTVSVCDSCVQNYNKINANEESEDVEIQTEMESDNSDDDDEEEDDEDEEYDEGEDTDCEDNQVVPWSPSTPPPTSTANSPSNSDEELYYSSSSLSSTGDRRQAQRKRTRENADRRSNVNCVTSSSPGNADAPPATVAVSAAPVADRNVAGEERVGFVDSLSTIAEKSLKRRRIGSGRVIIPDLSSRVAIESIKRLHKQEMRSSAAITELRRLSDDPPAVDYDSSESS